jgi:hypothetical protein
MDLPNESVSQGATCEVCGHGKLVYVEVEKTTPGKWTEDLFELEGSQSFNQGTKLVLACDCCGWQPTGLAQAVLGEIVFALSYAPA